MSTKSLASSFSAARSRAKSISKEQRGAAFEEAVAVGFLAQNKAKMVGNTFIGRKVDVKSKQDGKTLTDVDFICKFKESVTLHQLFPLSCQFASDDARNWTLHPEGRLFIEATVQDGDTMATAAPDSQSGLSYLQKKFKMYDKLAGSNCSSIAINPKTDIVIVLYNGVDRKAVQQPKLDCKLRMTTAWLGERLAFEWTVKIENVKLENEKAELEEENKKLKAMLQLQQKGKKGKKKGKKKQVESELLN